MKINNMAASLLKLLLICAFSILAHTPGFAQDWPVKPIKVILPYTPGGSVDTSARLILEPVSKALGQPIVVENKPGANTTIGTTQLAKSPNDGYTFGVVPATYAANYAMFNNLPYKHSDLASVVHLVSIPMYLFTRSETPAKDVKELVQWAKNKPVSYASTGLGSTGHFLGASFTLGENIPATHVPYNGSSQILADLMSGQIDFLFDPAMVPMPHVKAGKLKALAVSLPERCACTPDTPTMQEAGISGFVQSSWTGLMAPAGTPTPIIERMATEVRKALENQELRQKLAGLGMLSQGSTPQEFEALISRDTATYARIAQQANISLKK